MESRIRNLLGLSISIQSASAYLLFCLYTCRLSFFYSTYVMYLLFLASKFFNEGCSTKLHSQFCCFSVVVLSSLLLLFSVFKPSFCHVLAWEVSNEFNRLQLLLPSSLSLKRKFQSRRCRY